MKDHRPPPDPRGDFAETIEDVFHDAIAAVAVARAGRDFVAEVASDVMATVTTSAPPRTSLPCGSITRPEPEVGYRQADEIMAAGAVSRA
jgi:hypothetical protein